MKDIDTAMEQLFAAKWNIPMAAKSIGLDATQENWSYVKKLFSEYCKEHSMTWEQSS